MVVFSVIFPPPALQARDMSKRSNPDNICIFEVFSYIYMAMRLLTYSNNQAVCMVENFISHKFSDVKLYFFGFFFCIFGYVSQKWMTCRGEIVAIC